MRHNHDRKSPVREGILIALLVTRCVSKRLDALFWPFGEKEAVTVENAVSFLRGRYCAVEETLDMEAVIGQVDSYCLCNGRS
jgi:hypothetical protein